MCKSYVWNTDFSFVLLFLSRYEETAVILSTNGGLLLWIEASPVVKTYFHNSIMWDIYVQDNVFIISNPKSKYPVLQLDLRLVYDYMLKPCFLVSEGK